MVDITQFVIPFFVFVIFGPIGLIPLRIGLSRRKVAKQLVSETEDLQSCSEGSVKVTGTAHAIEENGTVESPITGTETVAFELIVEKWSKNQPTSGENSGPIYRWSTKKRETEKPKFLLEGHTGNAVVDPELSAAGWNMELESEYRETIEDVDQIPTEIEDFLLNQDETFRDGILEYLEERLYSKIRITERVIEPDETVYVLGEATRNSAQIPSSADTDLLIDAGENSLVEQLFDRPLVITDKEDYKAADVYGGRGNGLILFGLFWIGLCFFFLLLPILNS